ncbi:MAG: cytochrome [Acidimicrobiales bacterium]|jgi:cytochrome P450|nr:cytochrome [Acidimicrobiales bacterium]
MSQEPLTEETKRAAAMAATVSVEDLLDLAAPQHGYAQRIEQGGFFEVMPGFFHSARRETTSYILRRHDLFSNAAPLDLGNVRPLIPLNVDPPQHTKYRKILDPLFAPRRMDAIEDDLSERANRFIDGFIGRRECNFSKEYAEVFPASVFLGLFGLPWEELDSILEMRDGIMRPGAADDAVELDPDKRLAIQRQTGARIYDYFDEILEDRSARPQADMLTGFLTTEIDGERLSREEILDICFLFVMAGLDTVSDTLSCFYAFLARHPDHQRQIVANPAVIPGAVEEMLRWESPVPSGAPRIATEDTLVQDHRVPAGAIVQVSYGAANVDPSVFDDPFDVRFDRDANNHIAFGAGVHRCLGRHLARRELRVTLREWHRRIPDYGLKPGCEDLVYPPGLRSVKDLMLVW